MEKLIITVACDSRTSYPINHLCPPQEDIAGVARLSPSQVVRSFRAAFGVSPHRYVTGQRVAEAQRLLQTSRLPVTDIAMSLGFASPSHFSETFRRHTGVTPSVFRAARID